MTDLPLSLRIRAALADHAAAFPHGDWRAVNERLSSLWREALPLLLKAKISPWVGNEERAAALEAMGQ